jgi:hypothetical protein
MKDKKQLLHNSNIGLKKRHIAIFHVLPICVEEKNTYGKKMPMFFLQKSLYANAKDSKSKNPKSNMPFKKYRLQIGDQKDKKALLRTTKKVSFFSRGHLQS